MLTVLAQHLLQMVLGLLLLEQAPDSSQRTYLGAAVRFCAAAAVMDAWQFSFHKVMHEVDWLYRHVHSWHHMIAVPYSYGALYQHPLEMLVMDTLSGLVAVEATGTPVYTTYAITDRSSQVVPAHPCCAECAGD